MSLARRQLSVILAVMLAVAAGAPSSGAAQDPTSAPASEPPSSSLVSAFASDYGTSEGEAARRLDVQARAGRMLPSLKDGLGKDFAGMWVDPETGRVGVGALRTDSEAPGAITEALKAYSLLDETDVVPVQSTTEDLQAAQYTIGVELAVMIGSQSAMSQIDDSANRVTIVLSPQATKDDRERAVKLSGEFRRGRSAYGPPVPPLNGSPSLAARPTSPQSARQRVVEVKVVDGPSLAIKPTVTCSSESCSPPLRAGVKIINNGDSRQCSAGFNGRWWNGSSYEYFILTAGHCIHGTNPGWHWRAYNPAAGNSNNIGQPWSWRYGANYGNVYAGLSLDIGIIHIDSGGYWGTSVTNALWMHGWPGGVLWTVGAQATAYQGEYGCRTGYASAYSCGSISSVNGSVGYGQGEGGVTNLLVIPGACAVSGDSGGAFVDGGTALGITSGSANYANGSCAWGLFAHAEDVGNWLGVWALT